VGAPVATGHGAGGGCHGFGTVSTCERVGTSRAVRELDTATLRTGAVEWWTRRGRDLLGGRAVGGTRARRGLNGSALKKNGQRAGPSQVGRSYCSDGLGPFALFQYSQLFQLFNIFPKLQTCHYKTRSSR
jgi:hypothetical protein